MTYELSFAGVPFCLDHFQGMSVSTVLPDKLKHEGALERIWRLLPESYLQEFAPPEHGERRTTNFLAKDRGAYASPSVRCKVGDWYYPTGATKWSVFKGLAASSQVKEMLRVTGGQAPAEFVLRADVRQPVKPGSNYDLSTLMYLLPPRPLAEHGGAYDGLYLVTLVDVRYHWQWIPASLSIGKGTTWTSLVASLATILGATITPPTDSTSYTSPELDSQFWSRCESVAMLLDAVAHNTGTTIVRAMDDTYSLMSNSESLAITRTNRLGASNKIVREAGGEMFASGTQLRVGNLQPARNAVVPASVVVSFPKYTSEELTPHFINPREESATWVEDGYGDTFDIAVPVRSGGTSVSGLTGIGRVTFNDSAKAVYSGEIVSWSGFTPTNASALNALAMRIAQDHYDAQVLGSLDEVYEGTVAWTPEGLHDLVWSYSNASRGARLRVMRSEWTLHSRDLQHSTPTVSGFTKSLTGQPGHSVALTLRDTRLSGEADDTTLSLAMLSGDYTANVGDITPFPELENWKGMVGGETVIFRATSGTDNLRVIKRGVDGTVQQLHGVGVGVQLLRPDREFGINLITFESGLTVSPGEYTSGGLREAVVRVSALDVKVKVTENDSTTDYLLPKLNAGPGITLTELNDGGYEQVQISANPVSGPDIKVKASFTDSTTDYLFPKLLEGANIIIELVGDPDTYQQVKISANTGPPPVSPDIKVKVTSNDSTTDYLLPKLNAGANITLTELNDGGYEQVRIAAVIPTPLAFSGAHAIGPEQIITGGQWTIIEYTGVVFDTDQYWLMNSPGTFIVPTAGYYTISAHVQFNNFGTAEHLGIRIVIDPEPIIAQHDQPTAKVGREPDSVLPEATAISICTAVIFLTASTRVFVQVFHNALSDNGDPADLRILSEPRFSPDFRIARLGIYP